MQTIIERSIDALWITLGAIWLLGALRTKPSVRSQGTGSRAMHLALLIAAGALTFSARTSIGPLGWRLVPVCSIAGTAGLVMTAAGVGLAIWARLFLGGNWSATVTLKEGHSLVRSGPYRLVRHPIYAGCLMGMLGTAFAFGELRCFLGWAIALLTWWKKSRVEEQFLLGKFGEQYAKYQREVKALIPFVL